MDIHQFFSFLRLHVDQFIAAATGVGTLAAAVATFLTIRQLALQRRASYKPELVLVGTYVTAGVGTFDDRYKAFRSWSQDATEAVTEGSCSLVLENIGLGVAKNVKVMWESNYSEIFRIHNELAKKVGIPDRLRKLDEWGENHFISEPRGWGWDDHRRNNASLRDALYD